MNEVQRYYVGKYGLVEGEALGRLSVVLAADFDNANLLFLDAAERCIASERREKELQSLLTAADERADVLEGLLREVQKSARKQDWSSGYPTLFASVDAALKPAEEPRNQCDGCQAGIPVVNGAHRMGKPDGYPDTMSCTAKLYKPASGSTCNQILEESGLPTNYPCKSCGRGACIDR